MRNASQVFLDALRGTHAIAARARVCTPGQIGVDPDGTEITIVDGDVRIDGQADVRGTLDLTTDGTSMWPATSTDLLSPYGAELYVERGIDFGNGRREFVGLGYYRIRTIEQDDPPDGPIRIAADDRMAGLIDARLVSPRQYPAGTQYASVFAELVGEVYPGVLIDWDYGGSQQLARPQICDEDRWGFLDDLATAAGKIWYWDHRGRLQVKDPPSPGSPVWSVNAGENGVLITSQRLITRTGVFNAVVVSGEGLDAATPVRGFAYDADANSPTYYYGPFGKVPKYISSSTVANAGQAQTAARNALAKRIGAPYTINFAAIANAALEPWDPVEVVHDIRTGYEIHILSTVTIPLTADRPMTADTREQSGLRIANG